MIRTFAQQKPHSVLTLHLQRAGMTILLRLNTLFLLALSAIFCTVSARPQVNMIEAMHKRVASPTSAAGLLTNSARMAAGLGPLPPRNLFKPSRVNGVLYHQSLIHLPFLKIVSMSLSVARSGPSAIT